MNKELIKRILEIEKKFPIKDYNVDEHIEEIVKIIEAVLEYKIADRIKLDEVDCTNKDSIERSIFKILTIEELRYISYYPNYKKP